jgi:hypothetical protein
MAEFVSCVDCLRDPDKALLCKDAGFPGQPGNCHQNGVGRIWIKSKKEVLTGDEQVVSLIQRNQSSARVRHFSSPCRLSMVRK